ncbi:MAG: hypothetical protein HXS53_03120 [Theionarchaea archaeon]|nr:hypothetical protein [Theionarchaea archaeon]
MEKYKKKYLIYVIMIPEKGRFIIVTPFILNFFGGSLLLGGGVMTILLFMMGNRFEPFLFMGISCLIIGLIIHYMVYRVVRSFLLLLQTSVSSGMVLFSIIIMGVALILEYIPVIIHCIVIGLISIGFISLYFCYKGFKNKLGETSNNIV